MRILHIAICFIICASVLIAFQDGKFSASVDKNRLALGDQLEVTFTLDGSSGGSNFQAPAFNDFMVISGPNQSTNMQFMNGAVSSSVSYSYVLQPKSEGRFTVGPAKIDYGGKRLETQPVGIEVSKGAVQQKAQGGQSNDAGVGRQIGDNLFLKVTLDKTRAYQGEQITATYKLYNRARLTNLNITKGPALTGFWNEDVEEIKQAQFTPEVVNGKQYNVAVLKKVALFPQHSGTLIVDPMEVRCIVQIQNQRRSNDIFDQFFNDPFFGNFSNYEYKVSSEPVKVTIVPLPGPPPAGFGGAVGRFSMESWLDKRETKTNEPVTLKIKLSGHGNLKLLGTPGISIPPDFDRYDPKISDNINHDSNLLAGSRTFEFLLIPRHTGEQKISSFPFAYFDVEKKNYVTLSSPEFTINVAKGSEVASSPAAGISKEDVKLLGEDIRFIRSGTMPLRRKGETFVGSPAFFALSFSPILSFIGFVFYVKRRERIRGDVAGLRNRKARKMAQRRLAEAKKFLDGNKKEEFYTEVSRALWGYASDKLGIPPADLSLESLRSSLGERGVTPESLAEFASAIEQCDFARFAPSGDAITMDRMYQQAVALISAIEGQVR